MDTPPIWPVYVWGAVGMFLPAFGFGFWVGKWYQSGGRVYVLRMFDHSQNGGDE